MNKYKMIATDLDGTLLGTNLKISEENRQAMSELTDRGVIMVPATGRTLCEIEDILNLPEVRYVIYSNGAAVYDKKTEESILFGIDGETLRFVFDTVLKFDIFMIIHKNGKTYADKKKMSNPGHYNLHETVVKLVNDNCILEEDFEKHYQGGTIESLVVFFANEEDIDICNSILLSNPDVQTVTAWASNMEILSKDAGKGCALKALAGKLDIVIEDVISVGDGDNDRQMISVAGLGLATENGRNELKEVADKVICSNDEHVMKYIKDNYFE